MVRWTFKDGTVQEVKQEEHSVDIFSLLMLLSCKENAVLTATFCFTQSIYNYITYSTIDSNPAITYTSVISTIRCFEVTSGPSAGSTYVQWSAHFSSDADAGRLLVSIIFRMVVRANLAKSRKRKCFFVKKFIFANSKTPTKKNRRD